MISPPHSLCHLKRTASAHQPKSRASKGSKSVDELKLHFDPFHMYIHHCWCVFIHCCHAAIQVSPSAFQGNYCRGDVLRHSSHNVMLLNNSKPPLNSISAISGQSVISMYAGSPFISGFCLGLRFHVHDKSASFEPIEWGQTSQCHDLRALAMSSPSP